MGEVRLTLTPGSHGQVAEITGAHTKARQLRVLQQQGIRHWLNAAGWPVVPVKALEADKGSPEPPAWRSRVYDAA